MKLAVVVLILGLCLAANAAIIDYDAVEGDTSNAIMEFTSLGSAEGTMSEDDFSLLGILYFTLIASLRTLKGVNCSIKHVMNIQDAGLDFVADVKDCNVGALKDLNKVLIQVQKVISTCNDIIHLNSNVCNNAALSDTADAKKTTPFTCFIKLLFKMWSLKGQVAQTVTLSKKLSSTPGEYAGCGKTAVSDLVSVFTQFPSYVKQCSKL